MSSGTFSFVSSFISSIVNMFDSIIVPGMTFTFLDMFLGILGFFALVAFVRVIFSIGNASVRSSLRAEARQRARDNSKKRGSKNGDS